ncbi:hypothetical protein PsorP6_001495 [Peronosclerospora sorghi]|uniref:Uncharacterized protein n=1 Tax=Peronosclerospora sorghi TaxID=230839 RepID=A0ACC0WW24_9STRA|nr:hypothetical protein PsorP6_001495 [Peronosclerospora sorghi]
MSYKLISNSIKEEGNSIGKLLHPRRSRKPLEQMKQHEESQKREMEQFREFLLTTEMRITTAQNTGTLTSAAEQNKSKKSAEEVRVVKSAKDKALEQMERNCMGIKNDMKINDWTQIPSEFDELVKLVERARTTMPSLPTFFL